VDYSHGSTAQRSPLPITLGWSSTVPAAWPDVVVDLRVRKNCSAWSRRCRSTAR